MRIRVQRGSGGSSRNPSFGRYWTRVPLTAVQITSLDRGSRMFKGEPVGSDTTNVPGWEKAGIESKKLIERRNFNIMIDALEELSSLEFA